jgi:hypothetical protein
MPRVYMDRFNLKQLSGMEGKEKYRVDISRLKASKKLGH